MKQCRIIDSTVYEVREDVSGMSSEEILEAWSNGTLTEVYEQDGSAEVEQLHTPFGYDPRWVDAINGVLADRDMAHIVVKDLNEEIWDRFIGPLVDAIEESELENSGGISYGRAPSTEGAQS